MFLSSKRVQFSVFTDPFQIKCHSVQMFSLDGGLIILPLRVICMSGRTGGLPWTFRGGSSSNGVGSPLLAAGWTSGEVVGKSVEVRGGEAVKTGGSSWGSGACAAGFAWTGSETLSFALRRNLRFLRYIVPPTSTNSGHNTGIPKPLQQ